MYYLSAASQQTSVSTRQACYSMFKLQSRVFFISQLYAVQIINTGICFQMKGEAALPTGREQLCLKFTLQASAF